MNSFDPSLVPVLHSCEGIALRDVFAAFALAGQLASPRTMDLCPPETHAIAAYIKADAMMAARAAGQT